MAEVAIENSHSSTFEAVAKENCKNSEVTASPVSSLYSDSSPPSSTRTIAAQIASKLLTDVNKNSLESYITTASSESIESSKVIPPNNCEDSPKSLAVAESPRKRKADTLLSGRAGKYAAFFTEVDVTHPKLRKYKRHKLVRCLLCSEEKVLTVSNIGRHLQNVHEQPVLCNSCGKEFSSARISDHRKICISISAARSQETHKEN